MWFATLTGYLAPVFLVMSPVISYSDQAISMHRSKSSAGFSLDIPLIMLVSSLLKLFYWPGAHFDNALLIQAIVMIVMQVALLKIALDHRLPPSSKGGDSAVPFAGAAHEETPRPFNFWQWRSPKPYWHAVFYLFIGLLALELILTPIPSIYDVYSTGIGFLGLGIEAILPIPQILTNARVQSCKGFRVSLLASWLIGDAMKVFWFFTAATAIPPAFKMCGIFQACCDSLLGIQYVMYGDGSAAAVVKEHPLTDFQSGTFKPPVLEINGRPAHSVVA